MKIIDLRSDTVTKPTPAMREAMKNAVVGDDVFGEDPTVNLLEQRVASMFGKESALFLPSGTMSNLTALLSWCPNRGSEVIVGDQSHIFLYEQAGACQFGGLCLRTVSNTESGALKLIELQNAIRDDDIHEPTTSLICIENTHNVSGGRILPMNFLKDLRALANEKGLPIHMDGARIWNALTKMNVTPDKIGKYVDSLSVCLSKGLGAPAGSLLVGPNKLITKARRLRKALGGGMRQAGILAAAGLQALDDFESGILNLDHIHAKRLENFIYQENGLLRVVNQVETNILFLEINEFVSNEDPTIITKQVCELFKERGILVSHWSPYLIRIVFHRDISEEDLGRIIEAIKSRGTYVPPTTPSSLF
jgi:threonine aldolase